MVGYGIKCYREELKLTPKYLADFLDVDEETYFEIEKGASRLSAQDSAKLDKLFLAIIEKSATTKYRLKLEEVTVYKKLSDKVLDEIAKQF